MVLATREKASCVLSLHDGLGTSVTSGLQFEFWNIGSDIGIVVTVGVCART